MVHGACLLSTPAMSAEGDRKKVLDSESGDSAQGEAER